MVLERIQRWYAAQCDDDWEHRFGIRIETLDNPGWLVKIDLAGTALEQMEFNSLCENTDDRGFPHSKRWMHCRVIDKIWQGAGDETKLERLLETFLSWAERSVI